MKIGIATDHNGVNEKKVIIDHLKSFGIDVVDLGILLCGTGIGMSIAANKIHGIRCARVCSISDAHLAKFHNNANIIAMSYKEPMANILDMIDEFIKTDFAGEERHIRRIKMIEDIDHD